MIFSLRGLFRRVFSPADAARGSFVPFLEDLLFFIMNNLGFSFGSAVIEIQGRDRFYAFKKAILTYNPLCRESPYALFFTLRHEAECLLQPRIFETMRVPQGLKRLIRTRN